MPPTTDSPVVSAAEVGAQLRALIEAAETLRIIDDPSPAVHPEFDIDGAYQEFSLFTDVIFSTYGSSLQDDFVKLLAQFRLQLQTRRIDPGACKAFIPAEPRGEEARIYFRMGDYVFLAMTRPDRGGHRIGLLIYVDPDAIKDQFDD